MITFNFNSNGDHVRISITSIYDNTPGINIMHIYIYMFSLVSVDYPSNYIFSLLLSTYC